MTELALTIENVWAGAHGGAAFTGRDGSGKLHRVLASGKVLHRAPLRGESWTVAGELERHPRFGWQVQASHVALTPPLGGEHIRQFLARNRAFNGVGEVRAGKLWSKFGDSLYDLLDIQDRASLIETLGAGTEAVVDNLLDAWAEQRAEAEVVRWLETHHFSIRLGSKVLRLWGAERQITAMGCGRFQLGVREPVLARMILKHWSKEELLENLAWLKAENAHGSDIYIVPDEASGLILLDDLTLSDRSSG